jgi:hypothetical protein
VEGIAQMKLRRTVQLFYRRVVRRFDRRTRLPASDFDLLYFLEGILRFCSGERTINAVFAGADIHWDDEDDQRKVTFCPLPDRPPGELVAPNCTWIARSHEAHWFGATIQDLALQQLVQMGTFAVSPSTCCFALRSFSKSAA